MSSERPTGTVTFLFTGIEGSTRLLKEVGHATYELAPTITRRLIEEFTSRPPAGLHAFEELSDLDGHELAILKLIAEGQSNGEIAETLSIGERTVKAQVSQILSKLDLRDRAQAVVLAYRTGLARPGG